MRPRRTVGSAMPMPDPSGGQAPRLAKSSTALHSLSPPLWIPAFAGMTKSVAVVYPGSESGTCFRINDEFEGTRVVVR